MRKLSPSISIKTEVHALGFYQFASKLYFMRAAARKLKYCFRVMKFLLFFRARGDAANAVPEGRHAADNVDDECTGEVEDEVVDVARAGARVDLRDLDRRDGERQCRGEEEDAPLPAEYGGQEHAHRRERDEVSGEIENDQPQRDIPVAVGQQVVLDGAQRFKVDRLERCVRRKAAAEGVVEEQHICEHPHIIIEQQLHIQPSAALPLRLRDAAEQRNAQQDRKRRRERELLFRTDNEVRRKLVEQVEAQQRRREQRRCAAK